MPKIAQEIGDVKVRSHTFRFIPPSATETLEGAEPVHDVPHGQDERVGDRRAEDVAGVLAVARRAVSGSTA